MIHKKRLVYNTFSADGRFAADELHRHRLSGVARRADRLRRDRGYQLVLSVTGLMATFAVSGIRFASTRLISEELGGYSCGSIRPAMTRCLAYGLLFGAAAGAVLWLLAEPIGFFCG